MWMNERMFNDTPARKTDRLLGVSTCEYMTKWSLKKKNLINSGWDAKYLHFFQTQTQTHARTHTKQEEEEEEEEGNPPPTHTQQQQQKRKPTTTTTNTFWFPSNPWRLLMITLHHKMWSTTYWEVVTVVSARDHVPGSLCPQLKIPSIYNVNNPLTDSIKEDCLFFYSLRQTGWQ